ncbi:MAG: hypothetical protein M3Y73_11335, partial [Actinomycetota bacterium]|nr:hypothetical protein [Actinomycetota bacterium]
WMFLVPVFGLLLGVVVLAERPAGWTLVGLALVLLSMGVALIRTTPTAAGMPRHHPTQHHTDP